MLMNVPGKEQTEACRGIPVIFDERSYQWALSRIDELIDSDEEVDRLERRALVLLVEDFERRDAPDFPDDPVDAIEFYMAQHGLNQVEFAKKAKLHPSRVSEVISGARGISLAMIRNLHVLGFPLETLIAETRKHSDARYLARSR